MKPFKQWTSADLMLFIRGVDRKVWIFIGAGVLGFLLILVFLVFPAWIERPLLRRDIQGMSAQIRQVAALDQKRLAWEENQKIFGGLIETTQKRLLTDEDMGSLLGQISKMAHESRVEVLASKPLAEKLVFPQPYGASYQPKGYEFTVQGGYHDLAKFVSRIESHEKLLRIKSLQILSEEKTPERHIAALKLLAILAAPSPVSGQKAGGVTNAKK